MLGSAIVIEEFIEGGLFVVVSKKIDHDSSEDCSSIAQRGDTVTLEGNTPVIEDTTAPTVLLSIKRRWWHSEKEEVLLLIVNVVCGVGYLWYEV